MRLDITVAIVAMTDRSAANMDFPELNWDVVIKSKVLSSFFWGYFILQIPAGILARRFGPKKVLVTAMFICSVTSTFIPLLALHVNWKAVCLAKFIQGLSQGILHPCVYTHISKWAPPKERSRTVVCVLCGQQVGAVTTLLVTGYLAASRFGWPSVFYMTGTCGLIWTIIWAVYGIDSPAQHKTITLEERAHIEGSQQTIANRKYDEKTPWKSILTSRPVWTLVFVHVCNNWGFWTLVTLSPSYLSSCFGFDVKSNGVFSSLPHLSMFIGAITFGFISEYLNHKGILATKYSRKLWNSIAHWGGALSFLGIALMRGNVNITLVLITLALALNSATFSGFLSNHLDLSPNFAGIVMGLTNFFSNMASMAAPLFAGFVIKDEKNSEDWVIIFYTSAAIFFVSNFIFLIFGSTKVQKWNSAY
ncbi:putative inorganic phosphate cotransporter isoform X2 [Lycorma delicatula]